VTVFEYLGRQPNAQWHAQDGFEGFDKSGVSFDLSFEYFHLVTLGGSLHANLPNRANRTEPELDPKW